MTRNEAIFLLGKLEEVLKKSHMDSEAEAVALGIYAIGTEEELRKERDAALDLKNESSEARKELDCISREAAIDTCIAELVNLPSAQPELSCKTCRYNYQEWDDEPCLNCTHENTRWKPIEQPEPQWIPCSERLPEESGEYLCTLVGVHNTGLPSECGYEPQNNHGIIPGWSTCEADGFKFLMDDEVLAWMPLPEPWRGES